MHFLGKKEWLNILNDTWSVDAVSCEFNSKKSIQKVLALYCVHEQEE